MGSDPYKYFRIEARELLEALTRGVLELEKGGADKDLVGRLLRHAHTLKGAARIVKQLRISELSHGIEDVLAGYREQTAPVPHQQINEMLHSLDEISGGLSLIESPPAEERVGAPPPPRSAAAGKEVFEFVRVDIREMDALARELSEATVHVSALAQRATRIDEVLRLADSLAAQMPSDQAATGNGTVRAKVLPLVEEIQRTAHALRQVLANGTEEVQREIERIQDRVSGLRLLPASILFGPLERAARDAAESLNKQVQFEAAGGDNRLDAHVLSGMREALVHVIRNAIAHGIETPSERTAAGKAPCGQVQLSVARRGNRMAFRCRDDGPGLDVAQIRRSAVQRGLVTPAEGETLGLEDAVKVILRAGVTSTRTVTQFAGRGIGLDAVRETAARLKGEVSITSRPGQGTSVEIIVPVSLESLVILEVDTGGQTVGVPLEAVQQTARVRDGEIVRSSEGASVLWDGKAVPFIPLGRLLQPASPSPRNAVWSVVLLRAEAGWAAIGADRLIRRARVVMRPLPGVLANVNLIAGASLDNEGNPQPVVNPAVVIETALQRRWSDVEAAPVTRPPVLIIDDSLTTRMLEQSILETAGYEVDMAISGEEALSKARQRRYAMFIVDIEMPGMDGFDFIERVQSSPDLRDIPSILVTSRASAEDRLRAEKLGARGYIVKSEFAEDQFLRTIRAWVG